MSKWKKIVHKHTQLSQNQTVEFAELGQRS